MARKTNKTDHVLNLLSSGKEKDDSNSLAQPPVNPGKDDSVSVVQPSSENEQFAETIKRSLEEELEGMEKEAQPVTEEPEIKAPEIEAPKVQEREEPEPEIEAPKAQEPEEPEPEIEAPKAQEPEEPEPKIEVPELKEPEVSETDPEDDSPKYNFASVNVMEELVKDRALEYMEQFGICTCPRCIADTVALALSQLPPKYVVVSKEAVSPLLNFYAKKYAGQITVEITKACIQVGDVPHHTRD